MGAMVKWDKEARKAGRQAVGGLRLEVGSKKSAE
jgi:hypothetical protein